MICRSFSELYSAFVDGVATTEEQTVVEEHLRSCLGCHRRATQLRCVRSDISSLERDVFSREYGLEESGDPLSAEIVSSLYREARWLAQAAGRHADFIDRWRMRIFSQSVGALVSILLLAASATGVLGPAYRATLSMTRLAMHYTSVVPIDFQKLEAQFEVPEEVRYKMLLLEAPPPPPVFNPSGAVLGFGETLGEEDLFIATVKVRKDGRASVTEIVDGTDDPVAMGKLSDALIQQANFQPRRRRHYATSQAVLMFGKINISG
jgi:hypothetical protein